jgi:hypothetical protein
MGHPVVFLCQDIRQYVLTFSLDFAIIWLVFEL